MSKQTLQIRLATDAVLQPRTYHFRSDPPLEARLQEHNQSSHALIKRLHACFRAFKSACARNQVHRPMPDYFEHNRMLRWRPLKLEAQQGYTLLRQTFG